MRHRGCRDSPYRDGAQKRGNDSDHIIARLHTQVHRKIVASRIVHRFPRRSTSRSRLLITLKPKPPGSPYTRPVDEWHVGHTFKTYVTLCSPFWFLHLRPNSEPLAATGSDSGHVYGTQVIAVYCLLMAFMLCAFRVRRRGPASPAVSATVASEPASNVAEGRAGSDQGPILTSDRYARPSIPLVAPVVQAELSAAPLPARVTARDRPLTIRVIGRETDTGISLRTVGLSDPSVDAPLRVRPLLSPPLVSIAEPRDEAPSIQLSPPPPDLAARFAVAPMSRASAAATLTPAYSIFEHSERYSPRVAQSKGQHSNDVQSERGKAVVPTAGAAESLGAAATAIDAGVGLCDAPDSQSAMPATAPQAEPPRWRSSAQPASRRGVTPWRAMLHAPPRTSPALSSLGLKAVDGRVDIPSGGSSVTSQLMSATPHDGPSAGSANLSAGAAVLPVPAAGSTGMVTARSAAAESAFSLDSARSPGTGPRWESSGKEDAPLAFSALHTLDEERGEDAPLPDADDVMEADSAVPIPSCVKVEMTLRIAAGDVPAPPPDVSVLPRADCSRIPHIVMEAAPVHGPAVSALLVPIQPTIVATHNLSVEPDVSQDALAPADLPDSRVALLSDAASDAASTDTRAIPDAPIERPLFDALQTVPASAGSLSTSRGVFSPPVAPESSARGLISASEVSVRMHLPTSSSSRLNTASLSPRLASQPPRLPSTPPPSRQWSPAPAPASAKWEHDRRGVGTSATAAIAAGPRVSADRAVLELAMAALDAWEQGLSGGQHHGDRVQGQGEADAARPPPPVGAFRDVDADAAGDLWPEYRPLTVLPPLGYAEAEAFRADDGGDDEELALSLLQHLRAEARNGDDGAPPSGIDPRQIVATQPSPASEGAGATRQRPIRIESSAQPLPDVLASTLAQSLRLPPSPTTPQRGHQRAILRDVPHPAARPTVLSSPSTTSVAGYYRSNAVDGTPPGPLSPQSGLARAPAPSLLAAAASMGIAPATGGAQAAWVSPTRRPHERQAWAGVQVRGGGLGDFSIRKAASSGSLFGSRSRL